MNRVKASLWLLGLTMIASAVLLALPGVTMSSVPTETPAKVTLAQVRIGSVEQVLAITARLRYESEYAALAPATGVVEQVYVQAGNTVASGQALFRLNSDAQESALSALLRESEAVQVSAALREASSLLESRIVRAQAAGVVHQVSVAEHGGVTAGAPAVMLSTGGQVLVCSAVMSDAVKVSEGMTARVYYNEEMICNARVTGVGTLETDLTTGQTVSRITLEPEKMLEFPLGTALDAEIILAACEEVPVLPVEAIDEAGEVWWVAEGRCYRTQAGVILADEMSAWVALPEGASVVLRGDVVEGQKIREVKP